VGRSHFGALWQHFPAQIRVQHTSNTNKQTQLWNEGAELCWREGRNAGNHLLAGCTAGWRGGVPGGAVSVEDAHGTHPWNQPDRGEENSRWQGSRGSRLALEPVRLEETSWKPGVDGSGELPTGRCSGSGLKCVRKGRQRFGNAFGNQAVKMVANKRANKRQTGNELNLKDSYYNSRCERD